MTTHTNIWDIMKINLGCNINKLKGWVNVDINPKWEPEFVWDLTKFPYPFKSNIVEKVRAVTVLEHIEKKYLNKIMAELWRICKDGAVIQIKVPHYTSNVAQGYIDHLNTSFGYETFKNYFEKDKALETGLYDCNERFYPEKIKIHFHKNWYNWYNYIIEPLVNIIPVFWESTGLSYLFPGAMIEYKLKVVKNHSEGGRGES